MAKFRIDTIADLARQLAFAPHETRAAQLTSAERLLRIIDPAKAYPLEFIIFKITGYNPKSLGDELLAGIALQHDLGLLIQEVSETLNLEVASLAEPVLTIEDVTEKFNVTSKTIQRWRRKGLPGRRFIFPDGKRRVGFLLSSVDWFFAAHREQLNVAGNISPVDPQERQCILDRARRLAIEGRSTVDEITRRIGRRLNRSPLAILHTIRKHDEESPANAIFMHATEPLTSDQCDTISRAYRQGAGLSDLARRFDRPRAAIYRALLEHRVARINRKKIRFIDDALYHDADSAVAIDAIASQEELSTPAPREDNRVPRDLPPYLRDLYRTPLLRPARERALFLKFNFHKFQFVQARRRLDPQFARHHDLQVLEGHLRSATAAKNSIVQANLRLVVSVARKHLRSNLSLMELISDGNITLMRAVEGFDIHRGNRFSTYATLALMKGFARSVPAMLSGISRSKKITSDHGILSEVPDSRRLGSTDRVMLRDQVSELMSRLDERERTVLLAHYGLAGDPAAGRSAAATYEQVAEHLGLSKQRVRQIEQLAFNKLRALANIASD
jgi:RNA polymerase primary sigma factor